MNPTRYPLQWPMGWKRIQYPELSRFSPNSVSSESYEVVHQLEMLGATNVVISSNMQYKDDGMPYSRQQRLADTGVAVYFKLNGNDQCIPCDKWTTLEDNLRAIAKTIEALRGIERWGAKEMVNAAFRGFKALPETIIMGEHTSRAWWEVLQVSQTADMDVIDAAYKRLLHKAHPDKGGSDFAFRELQEAYKQAKENRS
jgi:DnaJ-domain-containing protein 1